jgi:hypothetical protein
MAKPTGRPRGRPNTTASVTLMTRVDVALADRAKRYAAAHRQPISVVIRDALTLLMEEYPAGTDPTVPHRLAAHEFLSDRYESPLDLLVGETEPAGLDAFVSDTNERVIDTILADTPRGSAMVSDTEEARAARASVSHGARADTHTETPARARSRKVSGRKAAPAGTPSVNTADPPPLLTDTQAAISAVPQRQRGRPSGALHQRILALLADHPEGLSAYALRVSLNNETRLDKTLQGLRQAGSVTTRGRGKALRYVVVSSSQGAVWTS